MAAKTYRIKLSGHRFILIPMVKTSGKARVQTGTKYRKYRGEYDPNRKTISVGRGLGFGETVGTTIHEVCHHVFPEATEDEIKVIEADFMRALRTVMADYISRDWLPESWQG